MAQRGGKEDSLQPCAKADRQYKEMTTSYLEQSIQLMFQFNIPNRVNAVVHPNQ